MSAVDPQWGPWHRGASVGQEQRMSAGGQWEYRDIEPNPEPYVGSQVMHDRMVRGSILLAFYADHVMGGSEYEEGDAKTPAKDLISDVLHFVHYRSLQEGNAPDDQVSFAQNILFEAGLSFLGDFEDVVA